MSKITDNELRELTIKMMEKTTDYYLNTYLSNESDNINKLIERDVAMRIVAILPDRYTEVTVNVIDFFGDFEIAAVFKTDAGFKLCVEYEYVVPYDPTSLIETYYFPSAGYRKGKINPDSSETIDFRTTTARDGRGSKVETLPGGQGLGELSDLEYFQQGLKRTMNPPYTKERFDAARKAEECSIVDRLMNESISLGVSSRGNGEKEKTDLEYFRQKVMKGLKLPESIGTSTIAPPTYWAPMTEKTPVGSEKPNIDFTTISLLSPPTGDGLERHSAGIWSGIDLTKVNVIQEHAGRAVKAMADQIDRDRMQALKAGIEARDTWAVSTSGWAEDKTNWDDAMDKVTLNTSIGYMPPSDFGGIITTDNTTPVWYTPALQTINFTEEDLDLLDMTGSKVMEFV